MNALHRYLPAEDGLSNQEFYDRVQRHVAEARQLRARAMNDAARRLAGRVGRALSPLAARFAASRTRRHRQRMVRKELSAYGDHELADTGIRRSDIPRVAREAA